MGVTWVVWAGLMHAMVKKGAAMGRRMVVQPKLCAEPPTMTVA
eukprot:CAMPEP_0119494016 /NCGR_PEP_ID=MMETSP1344-20130328/18099_1 /TAXON_ID=236787 /ORGANISM="Florenciella parvula, Strain CCMP2471" /LENGTH=42 /DNA_ID= /DNA_START= /DNA_END= /DNA_ORIENTATION=